METPHYVQYRMAASVEEAALMERILRVKDEILKLTPGFLEDAEELRKLLKPHMGDVYLRWDEASVAEQEAAEGVNKHNITLATPFARKWGLPFVAHVLNHDPAYLVDRPFSGAPLIDGSANAVVEWGKEHLPVLHLQIDIRFPKTLVLERIERRVREAQKTWKARGGLIAHDAAREVEKLENMLEVHRLRSDGMTQEKVATHLDVEPRQIQRLERDLKQIVDRGDYWKIAPWTHLGWAEQRMVGELTSALQPGRPIVGRMVR